MLLLGVGEVIIGTVGTVGSVGSAVTTSGATTPIAAITTKDIRRYS